MRTAGHIVASSHESGEADRYIKRLNPATDEPIGVVAVGGAEEISRAVSAARSAAQGWSRTAPAQRASLLKTISRRLEAASDNLARLITEEMGKPLAKARDEVRTATNTLEQYAELGPVHRGHTLAGNWSASDFMIYEPRGVVAAITPWNDPVAIPCGLVGAAIVTGNTVVMKPSERAAFSGSALCELFAEELPDGVINLVSGDGGTGAELARSVDVNVIAHVGSSSAGRDIARAATRTGARAVLENGGKDALIVDSDVDPLWAASQAGIGCFANAGQVCVSVERIYVAEAVAQPFLTALVDIAKALTPRSGFESDCELAPLVDKRHRKVVHSQMSDALKRGAHLLCGGEPISGPGAFYPATVLTDCTPEMIVMREETFGPVAAVSAVNSFAEALQLANSSDYGLSATVLTSSLEHAQHAYRELNVGTVKVNNVFGGAPGGAAHPRGISGDGFGYGPELLNEMTAVKVVHLASPSPASENHSA